MSFKEAGASNIIFIPPMGSNDLALIDAQLMARAKPSLHFFANPTRHLSSIRTSDATLHAAWPC